MKNIEKGYWRIVLALLINVMTFSALVGEIEDGFIFLFGILIMFPMGAITILYIHKYQLKLKRLRRKIKWIKNRY